MADADSIAVVLDFMERINSGDVEKICALMTEDHVFVDALGTKMNGRETMLNGWRMYHSMIPDYKVSHEEIFAKGEAVAVFGTARGTFSPPNSGGVSLKRENFWEIPAAWFAVVRGGKVARWQVYADNQPVRKLMGEPVP